MAFIQIKSNYNDFIKSIKAIPKEIDNRTRAILSELLEDMCIDMKKQIQVSMSEWVDAPNGNMSTGLGNDITYEINEKGNGGTIYVGRNTKPITLSNGNTVNPYMFIEFGFGIVGEESPAKYAAQNLWDYNINHHKNWIVYGNSDYPLTKSKDDLVFTKGTKGIDFFYNTISKYRKELKNLAERYSK